MVCCYDDGSLRGGVSWQWISVGGGGVVYGWSVFHPQVRTAKTIHSGLFMKLEGMRDLKSTYIFDNPYLTGQGHEKLSVEYAILALETLERQGGLEEDSEMSSKRFLSTICLPCRVLELWEKQMVRRFGHVASQSFAFERVVTMLKSRPGLARIVACAPTPLHGKSEQDKGIEECYHLVALMEQCKAGGHGPPATLDLQKEVASASVETSAQSQAEALGDVVPITDDTAEEEELRAIASSLVKEGTEVDEAMNRMVKKAVSAFEEIRYIKDPETFTKTMAAHLSGTTPLVILVDAATSRVKTNAELLDLAVKLTQQCGSSSIRIIITLNRRFDLMSKVMEKIKGTFPKWHTYSVPVMSKRQESRLTNANAQEFVFVITMAGDKRGVPSSVVAGKAKGMEQLRLRCTERSCRLRPMSLRDTLAGTCADPTAEINPDDKDDDNTDFLAGLCCQEADDDEADEPDDVLELVDGGSAMSEQPKRDYVVDLWPFARSMSWYSEVFKLLALGDTGHICIVLSTTAHPAAPMASLQMRMETIVLTNRVTEHSAAHGKVIAQQLCFAAVRQRDGAVMDAGSKRARSALTAEQFIRSSPNLRA